MSTSTTQPTILITGATDGIGLALARRYHEAGARLILAGRRSLDELDDPLFTAESYCQVDLSEDGCAEKMAAWLAERDIDTLDLLINNAGIGFVGEIADQTPENIRELEAVNLRAPMRITHRLLPLVEAAAGKLVYIGSVASIMPTPDYAVYTATKAALDAFVRNLQIELGATHSPARAQMIHPGATRTSIHAKSGLAIERVDWTKFPPAAEVAEQIERIINGNRRVAGVGFNNNLALQTLRRAPGLAQRIASRGHVPSSPRNPQEGTLHCVITGAADGIGRALALAFAAQGYTITGVDFDAERSMRTQAEVINQGGKARFIIADLSDAQHLARIVDQLTERPPIDVLIHNAGISAVGPFADIPIEEQMRVLDINFRAPLLMTRDLLANDCMAEGGTVVCISSLSHFASYPGAAVYAASKTGLASYASSLSVASMRQGVHALTVHPGPTRTAHARRYSPDNSRENRRMSPEMLARRILDAVHARKGRLIPGTANRLFALSGRLAPGLTEAIMRKTIFDPLIVEEDQ